MAKSRAKGPEWDLRPIVEELGLDTVIEKLAKIELIKQLDKKELLRAMEIDDIVEGLSPARRQALLQVLRAKSKARKSSAR
ncbi:MAG: hypothetical protein E6K70_14865 [Planctomycetota bacterium]|nr:MAG: hypothetical protein E6K70_14865 [Planctomycetota bacterium]